MKLKIKIKLTVDLAMSVLMLLLTTYQLFDHVLHEWFGAGMLVMFVLHTILNLSWYGYLFKGKYTAYRAVSTVLNFAVLASILCLGYSGIVISRNLFAFLPIQSGMATARSMHLCASYWGFVLMSVHLGLHWGMIIAIFKKVLHIDGSKLVVRIAVRAVGLTVAAFGLYSFISEKLASYMFLLTQFAYFDYDAPAWKVLAKYIAIGVLFVTVGYYGAKLLKKPIKKKESSS